MRCATIRAAAAARSTASTATGRVLLDLVLIVFFLRYRQRPLHAFGGLGLWLAAAGTVALGYLFALKPGGRSRSAGGRC
jgi:hypothetical protein